jgi:hypothetical protein
VRRLLLTIAGAALLAPSPAAAQDPIPQDALGAHRDAIFAIAAANGGHRAAGTPGESQTGDYAAARLGEAGWTISRTDVPFDYWEERGPAVLGRYRLGRDFTSLHYSGAGDVTARVRPVRNAGCTRRSYRRFPRGRIALLFAGDCTFRRAARNALRAGAKGMILADFTNGPPTYGTLGRPDVRLPVVAARMPVARRLARTRPRLRLSVNSIVERRVAQNVIAELPGTEGKRVVMAGGHMDSVPRGAGMNDNASGVMALIEIGRRLASEPRGRHTLRLAFWSAHEPGIFGSIRYVRDLPRAERRRISAYVNLDMVASPNPVPEIYASTGRIRALLARGLRGAGRTPVDVPSDHTPFLDAGVAVGGIYTGGLEPASRRQARRWGGRAGVARDGCYHLACDDGDNVNLPMLSRTATAAAGALAELAR